MTRTEEIDRLAASIPNRAAIVSGGLGCADEAVEIVRDLSAILESGYSLRLDAAGEHERRTGEPFRGRPMRSRFSSRCAVCASQIAEGEDIVYSREKRRAAHLQCGEAVDG